MKPVYRLMRRGEGLRWSDEWMSRYLGCKAWQHVPCLLVVKSLIARRRCTPREAAMARKLGLVK